MTIYTFSNKSKLNKLSPVQKRGTKFNTNLQIIDSLVCLEIRLREKTAINLHFFKNLNLETYNKKI